MRRQSFGIIKPIRKSIMMVLLNTSTKGKATMGLEFTFLYFLQICQELSAVISNISLLLGLIFSMRLEF